MPSPSRIADILTRATKHQGRWIAAGLAEGRHRREGCGVARVRRRGDRDHPPGTNRDRRQRRVAVRRGRGGVRLVHDQEIPDVPTERRSDVGALQEVHRAEIDIRRRPRAHASGKIGDPASQPPAVDGERPDVEPGGQLVAPLPAKAGRHRDEDPRRVLARQQIGGDPAGLDRLAQTDFVGEEHARDAARHCDCGRELIGENPCRARPRARSQRIHAFSQSGTDGGRPAPEFHRSNAWAQVRRDRPIERP
jgi:hypothetical protein